MQYYNEGMDFFHPRTYNTEPIDQVTGVEFPIQSYMSAALGYVFGKAAIPTIFRIITSLAILFGCVMLFRLVDERIRNVGLSLIAPVFLLSSPTVQHFTWSYLPDAFGAGLFFGAIYLAAKMSWKPSGKLALQCVALACVAALAKMSVAFYLPGLCIWLFFQIKKRKERLKLIALSGVGASVLGGWFLYMQHLNKAYESVLFLAAAAPMGYKFQPLKTWWVSFQKEFKLVIKLHGDEILNPTAYWILGLFALLIIIGTLRKSAEIKRSDLTLFGVIAIGSFTGTCMMGSQLLVHDYYAIVLWGPLAISIMVFGSISLAELLIKIKTPLYLHHALPMILLGVLFWPTKTIHLEQTRGDERNGIAWLMDAEIPEGAFTKDAHVFFPSENAPNLGQTVFDVDGISRKIELEGKAGILTLLGEAHGKNLTHAVLPSWQADALGETLDCQPQWIESIYRGDIFTIIAFKDMDTFGTSWKALNTNERVAIFPKDSCLNLPGYSIKDRAYCERVTPKNRFGLGFEIYGRELADGADSLFVEFLAKTSGMPNAQYMCIWHNPGAHKGLASISLPADSTTSWQTIRLEAALPSGIDPDHLLEGFLMNESPTDTVWIRSGRMWWR